MVMTKLYKETLGHARGRLAVRHRHAGADRQTYRQTGRQTGRQADRQTYRLASSQTDVQIQSAIITIITIIIIPIIIITIIIITTIIITTIIIKIKSQLSQ